jgi:hypothetical protein
MPPVGTRGKYTALVGWLEALPANQRDATLTLAEIEDLIDDTLPTSAWLRAFWASSGTAHRTWLHVGFRAELDRLTQSVRFTRVEP